MYLKIFRNKEREKEELAENHEAELKLYKQKVKHLMYEHQTNLSETKAEHLVALKLAQDDHVAQENELIKDKTELKKMQKEQELAYMNEIRALKLVRHTYNDLLQCIYLLNCNFKKFAYFIRTKFSIIRRK